MNGVAKWLASRLLNYGLDKLIEKIRGPKVIEAFERACENVIDEEKDLLGKYTLQALSSDVGIPRGENLVPRLLEIFDLEYLRGADLPTYKKELGTLWLNPKLRPHLRILLTEFMGSQANPNDAEISCLLPMLSDDTYVNRILMSLAGSLGWFNVIKDSHLPDLMGKSPEMARSCVLLLAQALSFERRNVLKLLQRCWLPKISFDSLILRVLQHLREWDGEAVDVVCTIAQRTEDQNIGYIIEVVSQAAPELAPRIVRADFERRLVQAEKKDNEQPILAPPSPDSSIEEQDVYSLSNDPKKYRKTCWN